MRKTVIQTVSLAAVFIGLHAAAYGALLTAAEIAQIQTALGVTLSSNDIAQLSSIVYPTNMPVWRADAYARINAHRKANLDIRVVDQNGAPVEGAKVSVQLKKNQFKFGGVCTVMDLTDASGNLAAEGQSSNDWKRITTNLFNAVGLNNAFKPKITGQHTYIPGFLSWASSNNLAVRGHTLMWPGGGSVADLDGGVPGVDFGDHLTTANSSAYATHNVLGALTNYAASARGPADKAALKAEVDAEITEWASRWNVYEWDVINETVGNKLLQDILGYDQMAEWFKNTATNMPNPNTGLLINEFKIISADHTDGGVEYNTRKGTYTNRINTVITNGGPITGIGFQSRYKYGHIDPATVYSRLDEFAALYPNLTLSSTEFEIKDGQLIGGTNYVYDAFTRAQMTEELLTTYFSHSHVIGMNAWDFMSSSNDPDPTEITSALALYNGTIQLNGLVWYYLHRIRYSTDAELASGLNGWTGLRAFKGDYEVTVSYKGQSVTTTLAHTNDQQTVITLASAVADDANTATVIDAWTYDGLTNGAGLASGISTGVVGGVSTPNYALASIQNETVRWQSDGVTDSLYRNIVPSSSVGAGSGIFQLSIDYLDADFSASAAVTNGSGWVAVGVRHASASVTNDVNFRLVFDSGNGATPVYELQVSDALGANQTIATFSGTTLDHLSVRAVYEFDSAGSNGSYQVYYRPNGGSEVAAYLTGQLPSGFALDMLRLSVQTYNGGVNWIAGDRIYTDNLTLRTLGEPPPVSFITDPVSRPDAAIGSAYTGLSLAGTATNAAFYSKLSGPAWLTIAANGDLSGTPTGSDSGQNSWIVQASNGFGTDTAVLHINVTGSSSGGPGGIISIVDVDAGSFSSSSGAVTGTVNSAVSAQVGDVVVVASATNKKGDAAPLKLTQTGGTGATGPQTVMHNLLSTYPTSWAWYMTVTNPGTFIYDVSGTNITAGAVLYILHSDTGTIELLASDTWDDADNANNGTAYSLSYSFGSALTNGVLIEAVSARTDNITKPAAYIEDFNGSNRRVVESFTNVTGSSLNSAYTLSGGTAGTQTSGALGLVFVGMTEASSNHPPVFNSDPVVASGAAQDAVYSASLANSASDADANPLSFFKVFGPAWLGVNAAGALSGTPASGDLGTNRWKVAVTDGISTNFTTLEITVSGLSVTPQSLYHDWLNGKGYTSNTNLLEDANGDGINNLIDYAIGGAANLPASAVDGTYLTYVHVQWNETEAAARGLSYAVQVSSNLVSGAWSTNGVEPAGSAADTPAAGYLTVTNRIPVDAANSQFIRLRVEMQ